MRRLAAVAISRAMPGFAWWTVYAAATEGNGGRPPEGRRALRALFEACSGKLMALSLRLLGDRHEAEDVVQETFLELWWRESDYDPHRAEPCTWAIVIGRSRALDRLRSRGRYLRLMSAYEPESAPPQVSGSEHLEARADERRVREALADLPAEQREVIELAYFQGLAQREIAERTRHPLGTVKTRVRLAMAKLADALEAA